MATLTIIAVLATFPSVLAALHITGTETHYVNFTCKPPPYLGLKKLFSLQLLYTTKSHFHRILLDVPREEHFNSSVGDVPTLFSYEGKVIESDAASSFLMASFPLNEHLYGNYSCVTLYEPLEEAGTKRQWTHLEIDRFSVNQESGGFRANVRPAYKVNAQWLLGEVERKSIVTISRHMQNNTIDRQELVICKLVKDQPHCFTFPVVSDFKLSYSPDSDIVTLDFFIMEDAPSPYMNYVINITECTLRSCSRELCTLPTNSSEDCDCTVLKIVMPIVIAVLLAVLLVIILFVFRRYICCRQCRRNRRNINNDRNGDEMSPINAKRESNEGDEEHGVSSVQALPVGELSRSSPAGGQQDFSFSPRGQRNSSSRRDQRGSGAQQNSSLLDGQQSSFPSAGGQNEFDAQQNYSTPTGGQNNFGAQQNSSPPTRDQQNPLPPAVSGQSVQEDIPGNSEQATPTDVDVH